MKNRYTLSTITMLSFLTYFKSQTFAQEVPAKMEDPLKLGASYTGDNVNNLAGGIKTGSCYLGLAHLFVSFDTKKAGLWKGGQIYLNTTNTHGASPSIEYIGDLQTASNIEAGNHTFFQELWYKQIIGNVELTAGLQDLNIQFANTDNGAVYLNSSFGILPTISANIPAPVYPLTSLGFSFKWNMSGKVSWNSAVYDGNPLDFDHNPYNLNWKINPNDGILAITEFQYTHSYKDLPATYKVGVYSHNHWFSNRSHASDSIHENNYGFYAIGDKMLWKHDNKSLSTFVQLGVGPAQYNQNYMYVGAGINYHGLFKNKNDVAGLAIATARLKGVVESETTIEFTYKTDLNQKIYIQPDVQYIINPAGQGNKLGNSLEFTLRLGLAFN